MQVVVFHTKMMAFAVLRKIPANHQKLQNDRDAKGVTSGLFIT